MKSLLGKTIAIGISVASAFAFTPAMATPMARLSADAMPQSGARVIQVQEPHGLEYNRSIRGGGGGYGHYRGGRHYRGGHYRHHRGHYYRHGRYYRHDNGAGVAAGVIAGAIVGGVVANGVARNRGGNAHVNWCYNRYRSYRASDNTFQPYNGPRRQCVSPY